MNHQVSTPYDLNFILPIDLDVQVAPHPAPCPDVGRNEVTIRVGGGQDVLRPFGAPNQALQRQAAYHVIAW
mgnify:CR=1 FL=1